MINIQLLLPWALPLALEEKIAYFNLKLPHLLQLFRFSREKKSFSGHPYQRGIAHEIWLSQQYGLIKNSLNDLSFLHSDAPLAPYRLLAQSENHLNNFDIEVNNEAIACLRPVHLALMRDHFSLLNPEQIKINDKAAHALFQITKEACKNAGAQLIAPNLTHPPYCWYLQGPLLSELNTSALYRASGRSIETWLPQDKNGRSKWWMKLQNEIEMAWFIHPLNPKNSYENRTDEDNGFFYPNSVWLYGMGNINPNLNSLHQTNNNEKKFLTSLHTPFQPFTHILTNELATRGLAMASNAMINSINSLDSLNGFDSHLDSLINRVDSTLESNLSNTSNVLIEIDFLKTAFLNQDWSLWQEIYLQIENLYFAPAIKAIKKRKFDRLTITLCGEINTFSFEIKPNDFYRFWRKTSSLFQLK